MTDRLGKSGGPLDFRLYLLGDTPGEELSPEGAACLRPDEIARNVAEFCRHTQQRSGHDFAREVFELCPVAGVLHIESAPRNLGTAEWLVLVNTARMRPETLSPEFIRTVPEGHFLTLPVIRFMALERTLVFIDQQPMTAIERFAMFFGDLHVGCPGLSNSYFRAEPSSACKEMLASKNAKEGWKGACIFYTRDRFDCYLLHPEGHVGFFPLDFDEPLRRFAVSFEEFLDQWLDALRDKDRNADGKFWRC